MVKINNSNFETNCFGYTIPKYFVYFMPRSFSVSIPVIYKFNHLDEQRGVMWFTLVKNKTRRKLASEFGITTKRIIELWNKHRFKPYISTESSINGICFLLECMGEGAYANL